MLIIYRLKSKIVTESFADFCKLDRCSFPTIKFDNSLPRGRCFYLASPKQLYHSRPYKSALRFVRMIAPDTPDTAQLYESDQHWLNIYSHTLSACSAIIALTYSDRQLSSGMHAELVWAHRRGMPIGILTWKGTSAPNLRLHLAGRIETHKPAEWAQWNAAKF